jgi:signal transduction histidine kinase
MSVAATDAVSRLAPPPRKWRWLAVFGFLLFVYVVGSLVAIYTLKSEPWFRAFVAPLPLVLIATLTFWRRQVWKVRARDWRFKEKVQRDALNSLAHETANGVNAIRANLAGFEEAESLPSAADHLKQVERSIERIDTALQKASDKCRVTSDV